MDALLSINHGQRPAIYVETVETLEPSDAPEAQRVKYQVGSTLTVPVSALTSSTCAQSSLMYLISVVDRIPLLPAKNSFKLHMTV